MFITALYKVFVILTFCCTGNQAFMKMYQWFYWTSNPLFERNLNLSRGSQNSLVPPCKISLGGPEHIHPRISFHTRSNLVFHHTFPRVFQKLQTDQERLCKENMIWNDFRRERSVSESTVGYRRWTFKRKQIITQGDIWKCDRI